MATTRKRTSGFSVKDDDGAVEQQEVEQTLDEIVPETFENPSKEEQPIHEFIPQEITPTDDVGPRFTEVAAPLTVAQSAPALQLKAPPKRHPRNTPKFSRSK